MPQNPPPTIPQSFLTAIAALTWGGNHLLTPGSDAAQHPTVRGGGFGAWTLIGEPGLQLTEATYLTLVGATASGGGYVDAAGQAWFLRDVDGWATPSLT